MTKKKKLILEGLYTYRDQYSEMPSGALSKAKNVNIDKQSIASPRKGYEIQDLGLSDQVESMGDFEGKLILHSGSTLYKSDVDDGALSNVTAFSGTVEQYNSNIVRFNKQNENLYLNTKTGINKLDSITGTLRGAGAPRGKYLDLSLIAAGTGIIDDGEDRAYRLVWGYKDSNNNLILGAPSERAVIQKDTATPQDVQIVSNLPEEVDSVDWFYQLYRTKVADTGASGDEMFLVYEAQVSSTDISNGYVSVDDITVDALMGASLYTNDTQEGSSNANLQPPACVDLASYQNHMFYGNTQQKSFLDLTLIGELVVGNTLDIIVGVTTTTLTGVAGTPGANQFVVELGGATTSINIDATARNLVKAISDYVEGVEAYYTSGDADLPGKMTLQTSNFVDTFTIQATGTTIGADFSPNIEAVTSSETDIKPNRVYFSKLQEPEAVPAINFFDVGSSDEAIVALAALRDRLVVIKENSVHRITGTDVYSFSTQLIDNTIQISEIKTVTNLSNRIFALSNQGIVAISDSVQIVSRRVNDLVDVAFDKCHATTKETDGLYILTCEKDDTYYSVVYNTFNILFTTWELPQDTLFSYNLNSQLVYSVPKTDTEVNVLVERNSNSSLDYSDTSSAYTVSDITGGTFTFSDVTGLEVGMTLTEDGEIGKVTVASVDTDNDTAEVNILVNNINSSGTWTAYNLIDTTIEFWPYLGQGIEVYKDFRELALIFETQISGTVATRFLTDLNNIEESVSFSSVFDTSGWGLFGWGEIPWGEDPDTEQTLVKRIMVPWVMGKGHELVVGIDVSTSNQKWEFSGVSLQYNDISFTSVTT